MEFLDDLTHQRLPLFLLFASFTVTFVVTRVITRLIRAGKGPFKNNVSDGLHVHHMVPGLALMIVGAFISVGVNGVEPGASISAVLVGVGASLVLDEFALILRLQDVYWSREGQLSVQVVALTVAALGMVILGFNPFNVEADVEFGPIAFALTAPINIAAAIFCVVKGKYSTAIVGVFIPIFAWAGAIRLARPKSTWARRRYSPAKLEKATARAQRFDHRWGRRGLSIGDWIAGAPTDDPIDPAVPEKPTEETGDALAS
ncbi:MULTISPECIES: hypothetical protein [Gordonia]|uniref:Integral membrane protein n=2 Tax=Gordonia alkanivorans TaxID=84096 RepID=F9VTF8_9ACTN|nr:MULTISPECIES: hypothetical protein [Gordonia]ETA08321.1 membrane protein [Gordonia alkanivorans CGMCC 6845]MDH3011322.1 hypothetical protein [Gordonia alkanivorans]MDH3015756.1 hypothetical protein [Gordonia alkanivorans]MDH3020790.1 hypothetical protein [Gordonia alkanivorans]MDH3040740.1 hypothetical protein [Gordonia alkanivorans]